VGKRFAVSRYFGSPDRNNAWARRWRGPVLYEGTQRGHGRDAHIRLNSAAAWSCLSLMKRC
jgi:hypothetical protein